MPNRTTLTGLPVVIGQDLLTDSSTQYHPLGTYAETADGRGFRYMLVGATSTVPGKAYQSAAQDTTNLNPSGGLGVSAAAAIGTTSVTISTSITVAANLVANGYMSVNVTPGQGYIYKVQSNTAVTAATGMVVTLADPLIVALTTSSKVVLSQHPYANVVVLPTTATGMFVGVATIINTNGNYGWLQTFGACSVLVDDAVAIGLGYQGYTDTVTGALTLAGVTSGAPTVGIAYNAGVDTEYDLVYLTLH